ncbi:MAG: DUF3604 domain-containing protein, partial [Pseudomonadota bacterium]
VSFDAVTSGNFGGVDLRMNNLRGRLDIRSNLVEGSVHLGELALEDTVLDAGGLERQIRVRRLPDEMPNDPFDASFDLPVDPCRDMPLWVRVTTLDGHQAWSSPIYLIPDPTA